MKRGMFTIALAALLCGLIWPMSYAQPEASGDPLEALAKRLADGLVVKKCIRVTVLDFGDIQDRPNELGRYLALKLANKLANLTDISVLDRANLEPIMREYKLTAEGLHRPEEAKKLGKFARVDAFVIGNVSVMGESVEIIVRAISTETSELVAPGEAALPATDEFRRMIGQSVDSGSAGSSGASGATTAEGPAIATREIGPITAVLRNVAEHSVQGERHDVLAIRCTFDLENRNLQRWVAVAATQRAVQRSSGLKIAGYRGALADSNRVPWTLIEVKGISAVVCFEYEFSRGTYVQQGNPGGIVDYIRTARKYDGGDLERYARYWSGSFGSIPPGQKIRMTLDFAPAEMTDGRGGSGGKPHARPDYFQFDMELVLGTYQDGEDPAKAKDLMLRNLTLDRVTLAEKSTKPSP